MFDPQFINGKEYHLVEVERVCQSCYDNNIESLQDWGRTPDVIYKLVDDRATCPSCIEEAESLGITVQEFQGEWSCLRGNR